LRNWKKPEIIPWESVKDLEIMGTSITVERDSGFIFCNEPSSSIKKLLKNR